VAGVRSRRLERRSEVTDWSQPTVIESAPVDDVDGKEAIDWDFADRVARRVAGHEALERSYLARALHRDFDDVTEEAEGLVAEHTGLRSLAGPAHALVLDRPSWASANLVSFRRMLRPVTDRMAARLVGNPMAGAGRKLAGAELGMLVGYLAQRVLGQYDLLVPGDDTEDNDTEDTDAGDGGASAEGGTPTRAAGARDHTDAVYYVGANVLGLEKRFAFRPRDFRLWIALHEVTHRAQFTGVPWMRPYFLGLVEESMAIADPDPQRLTRAVQRVVGELRHRRNPFDDGGIVSLLASPEHRAVLDRVQALMTLLEGHGNLVMDQLGAVHVHGQARMAEALKVRRQQGGLTRQIFKALGLEMKMRQYEVGERFCLAVTDLAGPRGIDAAWVRPENLPTLPELTEPAAWLTRVDPTPARSLAR
jgi:coenzyme F420 biosynthesis associated uncharacterized protein